LESFAYFYTQEQTTNTLTHNIMHIPSFDDFQKFDPSVQKAEFEKMTAELDRFRNQKYGLVFNENVHQ
jgi:hypothetical protein